MKFLIKYMAKILTIIDLIRWKIIYSNYREKYKLDSSFRFNGYHIQLYGNGSINTGQNSYIGELSTLQASEGYEIKIGNHCSISHNVRVYTQTTVADSDFSTSKESKYGSVFFEDYCWVGANVFINPGITVGKNSVVGANSVVTKNIPPNEIWGGVPARLIRKKAQKSEINS